MTQAEQLAQRFDVAVIGGGAAGLSAAVVLGRARRSVVVIDAGSPRNAPASGVHGFLSLDGISPMELVETGRKEVEHYGGLVVHGEAQSVRRTADGFEVAFDEGRVVSARRLLVTTGLVDELPDVSGVRQRWGRDVVHCPYCHGWEIRDQAVGVLGTGPGAMHQTLLFRRLTSDLVLFTHTAPALTEEQAEQLAASGVRVVTGIVDSVEVADDRITGVRLSDGTVIPRQAVVVAPQFVASSQVLATLGLRPTPHPSGHGAFIAADPTGLTEVPGVWVAGNVTNLMAQVVTAAAEGVSAAAAINADLITEDTQRAVTAYRRATPDHIITSGHISTDGGRTHTDDHVTTSEIAGLVSAGGDATHMGNHAATSEIVGGDATHAADHDHADVSVHFTQEFWDERYSSSDRIWSGNANPHLVAVAADLVPATALDVGSGEGADAIWLASQGWRVTGVDVSRVALDRAAEQAAEAGAEIAGRITWQQADVLSWDPAPLRFDLVSAQFMHLPRPELESLHRRLAAAVRPGGTLLIVGHHPSDLETSMGRHPHLDLMFTADQIAATLDPDDWHIVTAAAPERQAVDPNGHIRDAVLRAVRRH
ncbi:bifunctional NAD(P)/FAD-dependent oxidoreductase/class I SAM-dependent methyltransferase [Acrocarpospora sp. B8E8]|uniref:bifunctional NAD(P)/FAD-dependent oxidoreductase/class I SAM-dependent methyltransferase n=1 Tax=Acrocarpospora sp. B8E8 TaxID=3153572 RepID=UPI00325F92F6